MVATAKNGLRKRFSTSRDERFFMVPPPKAKVLVSKKFEVCAETPGPIQTNGTAVVLSGIDGDGQEHVDATAKGESSIAIAGRNSNAMTAVYGISIAGDGGSASCGASGAAIVNGDGSATSLDGSISFVRGFRGKATAASFGASAICSHDGTSEVGPTGFASVESGSAIAGDYGIASARGSAQEVRSGLGGVSIAWVRTTQIIVTPGGAQPTPLDGVVDPSLVQKIVSGEGGLIVSFFMDSHGKRRPIVGFVGAVEPKVQANLRPDTAYKLSADGQFVPV